MAQGKIGHNQGYLGSVWSKPSGGGSRLEGRFEIAVVGWSG